MPLMGNHSEDLASALWSTSGNKTGTRAHSGESVWAPVVHREEPGFGNAAHYGEPVSTLWHSAGTRFYAKAYSGEIWHFWSTAGNQFDARGPQREITLKMRNLAKIKPYLKQL
jgi:hypothetical protein